jgi:hypothetical protein
VHNPARHNTTQQRHAGVMHVIPLWHRLGCSLQLCTHPNKQGSCWCYSRPSNSSSVPPQNHKLYNDDNACR